MNTLYNPICVVLIFIHLSNFALHIYFNSVMTNQNVRLIRKRNSRHPNLRRLRQMMTTNPVFHPVDQNWLKVVGMSTSNPHRRRRSLRMTKSRPPMKRLHNNLNRLHLMAKMSSRSHHQI